MAYLENTSWCPRTPETTTIHVSQWCSAFSKNPPEMFSDQINSHWFCRWDQKLRVVPGVQVDREDPGKQRSEQQSQHEWGKRESERAAVTHRVSVSGPTAWVSLQAFGAVETRSTLQWPRFVTNIQHHAQTLSPTLDSEMDSLVFPEAQSLPSGPEARTDPDE